MTKTFNGGDHVSWDPDGRVTGRIRRLHTGDHVFPSQAYSPSVAKPCCENTTGGADDIDGDTDGFLQHARHDE